MEATKRASREFGHFRRHFRSNDPSSGDPSGEDDSPPRFKGHVQITHMHNNDYQVRVDFDIVLYVKSNSGFSHFIKIILGR